MTRFAVVCIKLRNLGNFDTGIVQHLLVIDYCNDFVIAWNCALFTLPPTTGKKLVGINDNNLIFYADAVDCRNVLVNLFAKKFISIEFSKLK